MDSTSEYKNELFEQFNNTGVIDIIKTKLRSEILQELKAKHDAIVGNNNNKSSSSKGQIESITAMAINQMIAEYMQHNGIKYSLSIFVTESGIEGEKSLTPYDMLKIFGLSKNKEFPKILSKKLSVLPNGNRQLCFLNALLEAFKILIETKLNNENPVENQHQLIVRQSSDEYNNDYEKLKESYEEAMKRHQWEIEDLKKTYHFKLKQEINSQVNEIHRNQIESIREIEAEKWQREIQTQRDNYENNYKLKLTEIKEREIRASDELGKERREFEKEIQEKRKLLNEKEKEINRIEKELEKKFREKQNSVAEFERQLFEREQCLKVAEVNMQMRTGELEEKEKTIETNIRIQVQREYSEENTKIQKDKLKLEAAMLDFGRKQEDVMVKMKMKDKQVMEIERMLNASRNEVNKLKESEGVLMKRMQMMQNELQKSQMQLIKNHKISSSYNITNNKYECYTGNADFAPVRDLIKKVEKSKIIIRNLKRKNEDVIREKKKIININYKLKEEINILEHKISKLDSLAKSSVKGYESIVKKFSKMNALLSESEQEKIKLQNELIIVKTQNEIYQKLEYGDINIEQKQENCNFNENVKNSVSHRFRKSKHNLNNKFDKDNSKFFIHQKLDRLKELEKEESKLKQKTLEFKKQLKNENKAIVSPKASIQSNKSSQAKTALLNLKKRRQYKVSTSSKNSILSESINTESENKTSLSISVKSTNKSSNESTPNSKSYQMTELSDTNITSSINSEIMTSQDIILSNNITNENPIIENKLNMMNVSNDDRIKNENALHSVPVLPLPESFKHVFCKNYENIISQNMSVPFTLPLNVDMMTCSNPLLLNVTSDEQNHDKIEKSVSVSLLPSTSPIFDVSQKEIEMNKENNTEISLNNNANTIEKNDLNIIDNANHQVILENKGNEVILENNDTNHQLILENNDNNDVISVNEDNDKKSVEEDVKSSLPPEELSSSILSMESEDSYSDDFINDEKLDDSEF